MTSTSTANPTSPTTSQAASGPAVHVTLVLDRSGSMQSIRGDVVGGVNAFIDDQKAQPGSCKLTMVQFDSHGGQLAYEYVYVAEDIANVRTLTPADFVPRGGTPLYDAIGRAITEADVRVGAIKVPEVQLFAIFTDGGENQSTSYNRQRIFEMIEEHQAKGWTFTYLGANQDAYAEAAAMGIAKGSTQAFAGASRGAAAAYASFSANTSALRSSVAGGQSVNSMDFYAAAGKGAEADLLARKPDDVAAKGIVQDPTITDEAPTE